MTGVLSCAAFLDHREKYAAHEPVEFLLAGHVRPEGGRQLEGAHVAGLRGGVNGFGHALERFIELPRRLC
jgi:hypothetical protein